MCEFNVSTAYVKVTGKWMNIAAYEVTDSNFIPFSEYLFQARWHRPLFLMRNTQPCVVCMDYDLVRDTVYDN